MRIDGIAPPPPGPIREPWELSVGALIRRRCSVPAAAARALDGLDRFGALRLRPESLGYDDCDVAWTRLLEIRTRPLAEALTQRALDREIERARKLLPPIPGRKWLLQKLGEELGELCHGAISSRAPEKRSIPVPVELVYRGSLGRTKIAAGGMAVTAILVGIPGTNDTIVETASSYGIPVVI